MNKQNLINIGNRVIGVAKVVAIVAVVGLTLVGGYVIANADVRDLVIDHAQGQSQVAGLD